MAHDRAFLARCEAFLLHPAVRALSLAQRVDFLEQKGLSPEEITACLKAVETQNGLSTLLAPAAAAAAAATADSATDAIVAKRSAATWSGAILIFVKRYGVVAFMALLLGYGYMRFRQRALEQLVLKSSLERAQRRARRATHVEAMLALISEQQAQYQQAATLLQRRVAKLDAAQKAAAAPNAAVQSATALVRKIELESLQHELLELKGAVVNTLVRPTVVVQQAPAESSEEDVRSTQAQSVALTAATTTPATKAMALSPTALASPVDQAQRFESAVVTDDRDCQEWSVGAAAITTAAVAATADTGQTSSSTDSAKVSTTTTTTTTITTSGSIKLSLTPRAESSATASSASVTSVSSDQGVTAAAESASAVKASAALSS